MEQWAAQIVKFTDASVGRIQRDVVEVGDVTVAMVQSLCSRVYDQGVMRRFGLVVVDEAHHMAAPFFCRALWQIPAARVLALSATPERADGLTPLLKALLTPAAHLVPVDGAAAHMAPMLEALLGAGGNCMAKMAVFR